MDFTSRQLRAFQLVAQHRNFSRAAEALFITPSGLSVLIRELEKQLGFRLFDRTTRHVAPTAQGSQLLAATRKSLHELDTAVARIGQRQKGVRRSISVGTTPLVAANILPQAIRELRTQRPDLHVRLLDADPRTILRRVQAGRLDIGLGIFKRVPAVLRTPLVRFSLVVIRADPDDGGAPCASTTWAALNGQPLISLPSESPHQQLVDQQLAALGLECPREIVVNYLDTQIALVEAGEGMAIIPSFGIPVARNRKVVMSQLINPTVRLDFQQISNGAKKLPPGADEFTAFFKAYLTRWAARTGAL